MFVCGSVYEYASILKHVVVSCVCVYLVNAFGIVIVFLNIPPGGLHPQRPCCGGTFRFKQMW